MAIYRSIPKTSGPIRLCHFLNYRSLCNVAYHAISPSRFTSPLSWIPPWRRPPNPISSQRGLATKGPSVECSRCVSDSLSSKQIPAGAEEVGDLLALRLISKRCHSDCVPPLPNTDHRVNMAKAAQGIPFILQRKHEQTGSAMILGDAGRTYISFQEFRRSISKHA